MDNQLKWDLRFMEMAKEVSTWSKDPSTKVGAVLVKDKKVVGMGYNGFPPGVDDSEERYANRELKYKMVIHAEVNAIFDAGKEDAKGATLYVYPSFALPPICNECAKVFLRAGVKEIVGFISDDNQERNARWMESISISKQMFDEAGVIYRPVPFNTENN